MADKDQKLGTLYVVAGSLLIVVALIADPAGLGQSSVFGYKQLLLAILGALVIFGGVKKKKHVM